MLYNKLSQIGEKVKCFKLIWTPGISTIAYNEKADTIARSGPFNGREVNIISTEDLADRIRHDAKTENDYT